MSARPHRTAGMPDPLVSRVLGRQKSWRAECAALRKRCLACGLHESLKWGQACYDLDGGNVVLIHGFRDYCALLFMKGALLRDPKGMLVQQTKNVQAGRQLRFESVAQIRQHERTIDAYIREAIALERSGARVARKDVSEYEVAAEFLQRLDEDPTLAQAFRALTPGRQKAYLLHFAGAKQSATRSARVARHIPRILKGLGLDD